MKYKYSVILLIIWIALVVGQVIYIGNDTTNIVMENGIQKAGELEDSEDYILVPGNIIKQQFRFDDLVLNKILLYFEKLDSDVTGNLNIMVKDADDNIISEWSPLLENMEPSLFYVVFFYEEGVFQNDEDYYVEISIENNNQKDCALKIVNRQSENAWLKPLQVDNEILNEHVAYIELDRDYNNNDEMINQIKYSIIISCGTFLILILCFIFEKNGKKIFNKIVNSKSFQDAKKHFQMKYPKYMIIGFILFVGVIGGIYHSLQDIFFIIICCIKSSL